MTPEQNRSEHPTFPNYLGQWVFVERETGDTSYNGEYLVVQQTPCTLYCTKLVGGYGGHELKKFPLVGAGLYKVLTSYVDDEAAAVGIESMKHWAGAIQRGEKLAWVEYVYTECGANARMAERAIANRKKEALVLTLPGVVELVSVIRVYSDGSLRVQPA